MANHRLRRLSKSQAIGDLFRINGPAIVERMSQREVSSVPGTRGPESSIPLTIKVVRGSFSAPLTSRGKKAFFNCSGPIAPRATITRPNWRPVGDPDFHLAGISRSSSSPDSSSASSPASTTASGQLTLQARGKSRSNEAARLVEAIFEEPRPRAHPGLITPFLSRLCTSRYLAIQRGTPAARWAPATSRRPPGPPGHRIPPTMWLGPSLHLPTPAAASLRVRPIHRSIHTPLERHFYR
jgi:hypothetical protein